ncbi:MAG: M23 family metallopeptidase [Gemmatimonadota bacterium]|nr:M23 family metallopeptidase [Gemmatimonadota bacterium]
MRLILLLCSLCMADSGIAKAGDYHWPMAAPPALNSSFGEYRPRRFHAGLDFKTWGKEGYPVLAVDDGYVWRVRTSPWGYGKVVYIRLKDGRTAVYAHLSGFAPRVQAVVEAEQERRGFYSVNLFFKPNQIQVERGETLGYSGSTGSGVPHLHFEIRDRNQRPINGLLHGFEVKDTVPPTVQSLALIPMDAGSRVSDRTDAATIGVKWRPELKRYVARTAPMISGRIGVSIKTYDRADATVLSNRFAPFRLRLYVNDREVFETTYTIFAYSQVNQVELDRNFVLKVRGAGIYHNLYRSRGNQLPMYGKYKVGDGVLYAGISPSGAGAALEPGRNRLRLLVEDAAGNRSRVDLDVIANSAPRVLDARAELKDGTVRVRARVRDENPQKVVVERSSNGGRSWVTVSAVDVDANGRVDVELAHAPDAVYRVRARDRFKAEGFQVCAPVPPQVSDTKPGLLGCDVRYYPEFAVLNIVSKRLLSAPPVVTLNRLANGETTPEVIQRSLYGYETVVRFDPDVQGEIAAVLSAVDRKGAAGRSVVHLAQTPVGQRGAVVRSPDGKAVARFDPDDVYEPFFGRVSAAPGKGTKRLKMVGSQYQCGPEDVPFRRKAEIVLRYPADFNRPERLGIYRLTRGGTWAFVGNRAVRGRHAVAAEVSSFSTYALLLDETPPLVRIRHPAPRAKVSDRRPRLVANIGDRGSGIRREEDILMHLDGKRLIAEYDPEAGQVKARPRQPLTAGTHKLEVVVTDACGNRTRAVRSFTVR